MSNSNFIKFIICWLFNLWLTYLAAMSLTEDIINIKKMEREVTKSPVIYFKTKKYKAFLNPQERIEMENIKNIQREQIVREETDYYTVQTFKKNVENYINNGKNN